jgi:dephospho-CoA kinase
MYLGLTGNIASGKSTVAKLFEELGCYTIDADEISKIVMSKSGEAYQPIIDYFGKNILTPDNDIDRAKLKEIVFSDREKLSILESIVHPAIKNYEKKKVSEIKGKNNSAIIITHAALIIEKDTYKRFDGVIVIYVSKEKQKERLLKRDKMTEELADKIINSQMPIEEKLKYADFIINNDSTFENLKKEVERIFENIQIYKYCSKQLKKEKHIFQTGN